MIERTGQTVRRPRYSFTCCCRALSIFARFAPAYSPALSRSPPLMPRSPLLLPRFHSPPCFHDQVHDLEHWGRYGDLGCTRSCTSWRTRSWDATSWAIHRQDRDIRELMAVRRKLTGTQCCYPALITALTARCFPSAPITRPAGPSRHAPESISSRDFKVSRPAVSVRL